MKNTSIQAKMILMSEIGKWNTDLLTHRTAALETAIALSEKQTECNLGDILLLKKMQNFVARK